MLGAWRGTTATLRQSIVHMTPVGFADRFAEFFGFLAADEAFDRRLSGEFCGVFYLREVRDLGEASHGKGNMAQGDLDVTIIGGRIFDQAVKGNQIAKVSNRHDFGRALRAAFANTGLNRIILALVSRFPELLGCEWKGEHAE